MGVKMELFSIITVLEIVLILIAVLILPSKKKTMVAMILAIGNLLIFITHVIHEPKLLSGSVSLISRDGPSAHLLIWDELGYRILDIIKGDELYTLVTALFIHANLVHIFANMLVLLLLGVPFEEKIGARNFAILFFGAGIGAALLKLFYYALMGEFPGLSAGANGIGASGAIFGVLGAFVALYPREKVMFPLGFILRPWPVYIIALLYGAIESFSVLGGVSDGVGHVTHFNGLLVGIGLALIMKKAGLLEKKKKMIKIKYSEKELNEIASTPKLQKLLAKIKMEEIPEIKQAWLEKLIETAVCPKCSEQLEEKRRRCKCGYLNRRKL